MQSMEPSSMNNYQKHGSSYSSDSTQKSRMTSENIQSQHVVQRPTTTRPYSYSTAVQNNTASPRSNVQQRPLQQETRSTRSQGSGHIECYGCGGKGHWIRDCPLYCEKCHKSGHVVSNCKVKQCSYCGKLYHKYDDCYKRQRDLIHSGNAN